MNPHQAKTAFITGGSKGIGLAIAHAFAEQGMNVTITARHEESVLEAAKAIPGPGRALGIRADVRSYAQVGVAIDETVAAFGQLDVLVVNAGMGMFKSIQETSVEEWQAILETNLMGAFYTIRAAMPELIKRRGYIFVISSLAGKHAFAGGAAYNASKFGLNGLTEAVMQDLRPLGVKVSQIMPGSVATAFNNHMPSPEDAWKIQPQDIAQLLLDLLEMPERTLPSLIEVRPTRTKP